MLYLECLWEKCTRRFFREDADPRHPSTWHLNRASMVVKDTLYCTVVPSLTLPSTSSPAPPGGEVGWSRRAQRHAVFSNRL